MRLSPASTRRAHHGQRARDPLGVRQVQEEPVSVEDVEIDRDRNHHEAHVEQVRKEGPRNEGGLGAATQVGARRERSEDPGSETSAGVA